MKFVREQSRPISSDSGLAEMRTLIEREQLPRRGRTTRADPPARHRRASTCGTCSVTSTADRAQAPQGRRQCRQWRRRTDHRSARAAPAVRIRQDQSPARWFVPAMACPTRCWSRTEPAPSRRSAAPAPTSAWHGTGTMTAASSSTSTAVSSKATTWSGCSRRAFLRRYRGARIVHDPRLTWNTIDIVQQYGGEPVLCKSGHAFIKQRMREVDAVYGGEMSAHHYFRDFAYCDSGMIPWLLVLAVMSESGKTPRGTGRRAAAALSGQRRDQSQDRRTHRRHQERAGTGAAELSGARAVDRFHRRLVDGIRPLAIQSAWLQYRAAGAPERGVTRQCRR